MTTGYGFKGGIPTARNIDHAGYTVPDIEQAIDFLTTVLGCESRRAIRDVVSSNLPTRS